eukprot:TRINITY_DN2532_c0_g1_i1.p1 TRINITY_DN2532_c0_g1~~TRINITY_DN2532_c0_g1_i1.p1  ORF type:complete len:215 (+),score=67.27 TRINITY_DN2532_c0_g1_i1:181-825(+)
MVDYAALTEAAFDEVTRLLEEPEEKWEYVTDVDGCAMHRRISDSESPIHCVRTSALFPFPASKIFEFIWNLDNRKQWDEYVKEVRVLEEFPAKDPIKVAQVAYQSFAAPFPVSHRDFVVVRGYKLEENGSYVTTAKSTTHPSVEGEVSGHVRGEVVVDGFWMVPDESNPEHTNVKYIAHVDPKGSIPYFVINLANRKVPSTMAALKAVLQKHCN